MDLARKPGNRGMSTDLLTHGISVYYPIKIILKETTNKIKHVEKKIKDYVINLIYCTYI